MALGTRPRPLAIHRSDPDGNVLIHPVDPGLRVESIWRSRSPLNITQSPYPPVPQPHVKDVDLLSRTRRPVYARRPRWRQSQTIRSSGVCVLAHRDSNIFFPLKQTTFRWSGGGERALSCVRADVDVRRSPGRGCASHVVSSPPKQER